MSGETAVLDVDTPAQVGNGSKSDDLSNGSTSFEGSVVSVTVLISEYFGVHPYLSSPYSVKVYIS